jgi:pantetheine-phosphate adenylyltransferase
MAMNKPIRAVFPGMFDPITNGHLDIIKRARDIVDELIVAVGHNPAKQALFSTQERVEMVRELVDGSDGIRVLAYEGLTADFIREVKAKVLIRGIRDNVDLHYELEQANINMVIGDVETVFLLSRDQYALTSSTYIKQIVELGCLDPTRLTRFVPLPVVQRLREKLAGGMPAELSSEDLRPKD